MFAKLNLIEILYALGFLGCVLCFLPMVDQPFELPKVWLLLSWCVLLIYGAIRAFLHHQPSALKQKRDFFVIFSLLLWFGWVWFSGIHSGSFTASLLGNIHRLDGLFTLSALVVIALIFSHFAVRRAQEWLPIILLVSVAATALSVVGHAFAVTVLGMSQLDIWHGAFGGIFGQPIFAAGFLAVTAPIVVYFFTRYEQDWMRLVTTSVLILVGVALFFTQAFGAVISVGFVGTAFLFVYRKSWKLGLIVFLVSMVILGFALKNQQELVNSRVADTRLRIWQQLYGAWQEKPLVGWGWAQTGVAFTSQPQPEAILFDIYVDKAHSHFIEMGVTTGIVGLVLYVLFLLAVFVAVLQRVRSANSPAEKAWWLCVLQMFCIYVVHTQTNVVSISEEVVFWTVVGLVMRK